LGIVVPLLILAAAGYHLGKSRWPVELRPHPAPPSAPVADPAPATPAVESPPMPEAPAEPPPPRTSEAADAEEALRAFLGAPDWQARSAFVFHADDMRPAMQKHAAEQGDGPISFRGIDLLLSTPQQHVFSVRTESIPEGYPVSVTMTPEGPKIGWDSFLGFHEDHFKKLLDGPAGRSGIFELFVKAVDGPENPHYERFELSVPMPGRKATAYARINSVALARLRAELGGSGSFDATMIETLNREVGGVPLVLALEKHEAPDGRGSYLVIVDLVAVQWGPRSP
jgi:hypothetical protein